MPTTRYPIRLNSWADHSHRGRRGDNSSRSLPPTRDSLIQDRLLHLATARHFGARRTHLALTRTHLTRGLNLWRSWTMVGSGDVTRDVHCQVEHAGNATGVSKSVHAVTIKVNAVTSL